MAYNFTGTQNITSSDPVDAAPLTIAFWHYPNDSGTRNLLWLYGASDSLANSFGIYRTSTDVRGYVAVAGGGTADFGTTAAPTQSVWNHCALVCNSATSRTIYLNAANSATNTTNITPSAANIVAMRIGWIGGVAPTAEGRMAEIGLWNAALTQPEIASLAKGMTCNLVRPQSLVFYAPLIRNLQDVKGGLTLTNNNTATVANHPRVYQ